MLTSQYIGVHVWLMTSKQTDPDLIQSIDLPIVDVGVEYFIHKSDRRTLIGVLFWQIEIDQPFSLLVCSISWTYLACRIPLNYTLQVEFCSVAVTLYSADLSLNTSFSFLRIDNVLLNDIDIIIIMYSKLFHSPIHFPSK